MKKEYANPKELSKPGTYTHVVSAAGADKLVYIAGQVAYAQDGSIVGKGDMRAQTGQVFRNLSAALKAAGAGWGDVIKLNAYMVDVTDEAIAQYREVRLGFLKPGQFPASTLVGVTRLADKDFLLEVEAIAVLGKAGPAGRAARKPSRKAKKKKS